MLAREGRGWVEQGAIAIRTTRGGENSSLSVVKHEFFSLGLGQIQNRPTIRHAHEYASCRIVETCTNSHVLEDVILMLGVVRHDNDVRVHRRFSTSVLLWSVGYLDLRAMLFLWTSRTKNVLFAGTLGVDPLAIDTTLTAYNYNNALKSQESWVQAESI
jgi:hypothetical protein